jgi:hypothetical protein
MKPNPTIAHTVAVLAMIMSLCWFVIVIADRWAVHALPSNAKVLVVSLGGMSVVGAVAGFVVSALANLAFRAAPPAMRVPFTVFVWLAFCSVSTAWLLHTEADGVRLLLLSAIVALCGLLVGPYHAELFVGSWFYKRWSAEKRKANGADR